ncbi:EPSP synthase (3-phosphoshikimate 1-carboxyvinyltransferase) [seawater metagenome]|uniref:UDP-N-acetylglucosamine 1-carboxyvinyltransferase n=1 Tax=seawater metagenome TaxID=1561972 RepID=A0A5E8CKS3_9ZZZZ
MEINIPGAKNSILPLLVIPCLIRGTLKYSNIPKISDVETMYDILKILNININIKNDSATFNSCNIKIPLLISYESNIRSSYYFFSVLSHFKTKIIHPFFSGCKIGNRSIELHEQFFHKLGVEIIRKKNGYLIDSTNFKENYSLSFKFDTVSIGATINAILLSIIGEGEIILKNCSQDLYVNEVITVLRKLGGIINIHNREIRIIRQKVLGIPIKYNIENDPIISGTSIIFAALSDKNISIKGINKKWLGEFDNIINNIGIIIKNNKIECQEKLNPFNVCTNNYPGLYTDLMPFIFILGSQIGGSYIEDKIFSNRFEFAEELKKIGIKFERVNKKVIISKSIFTFNETVITLNCPDLRGGAAILLASCLCIRDNPDKQIILNNYQYIQRGYSNIKSLIDCFDVKLSMINSNQAQFSSSLKPINLHSGIRV